MTANIFLILLNLSTAIFSVTLFSPAFMTKGFIDLEVSLQNRPPLA